MKKFNKDNESSYIMYWDTSNMYGWAMSQKLPVDGFKLKKNTSKINEKFIKKYDEDIDKRYMREVDVEYPKRLHKLNDDLSFLCEKMKIEKYHKLVCNLHIKTTMLRT